MLEGYIYIIENPDSRLGLLKIGKTSKTVAGRLLELNNTSVGEDFVLIKKFHVEQVDRVEKIIHRALKSFRHRREWFQLTTEEAIKKVGDICIKYSSTYLNIKKEAKNLWLNREPLRKDGHSQFWGIIEDNKNQYPQLLSELKKELGAKKIIESEKHQTRLKNILEINRQKTIKREEAKKKKEEFLMTIKSYRKRKKRLETKERRREEGKENKRFFEELNQRHQVDLNQLLKVEKTREHKPYNETLFILWFLLVFFGLVIATSVVME